MQTWFELDFTKDELGVNAGYINEDRSCIQGSCKIAENTVTELWYERQKMIVLSEYW